MTFSSARDAARAASDAELDKLHAKIGQLLVEDINRYIELRVERMYCFDCVYGPYPTPTPTPLRGAD